MKSSWVYGWNLAEGSERLTANAQVAAVLGLIQVSSDIVEFEGAADETVLNIIHKKQKIFHSIILTSPDFEWLVPYLTGTC